MSEIKLFKIDKNELFRKLRRYVKKIADENVLLIVLIGSFARGDYTAFSDLDLVIIVKKDPRRPMDRIPDYLDPSLDIDVEPRVYTIDEIIKMALENRRIIKEIIEYGIILYGRSDLIEKIKKIYSSIRK